MLPPDAVLLASSADLSRADVPGAGENLYATQFHPELDLRGHHHPHRRLPRLRLLPAGGVRRRGRPGPQRRRVVTEPGRMLANFVARYG